MNEYLLGDLAVVAVAVGQLFVWTLAAGDAVARLLEARLSR